MSTDPSEQPSSEIGVPECGEATDSLIRGNRVGGPSPISYMNEMLMRRSPIEDDEGVTPRPGASGVELFGRTFSHEAIIGYGALAVVIIGVIALLMGPGS
jgi:hypothetical protein